jgi:hypothetical protein
MNARLRALDLNQCRKGADNAYQIITGTGVNPLLSHGKLADIPDRELRGSCKRSYGGDLEQPTLYIGPFAQLSRSGAREEQNRSATTEITVRYTASKLSNPSSAGASSNELEAWMIEMSGEGDGTKAASSAEIHQNISEWIAFGIEPIFGANLLEFRTHGMLVVRSGGMAQESGSELAKGPGIHHRG